MTAELAPLEHALATLISDLSERAYAAGWLNSIDGQILAVARGETDSIGLLDGDELRAAVDAIIAVARTAGCWMEWDGDAGGPTPVELPADIAGEQAGVLGHYSAALDALYNDRAAAAEALEDVTEALKLSTLPKTARERLESIREVLSAIAAGRTPQAGWDAQDRLRLLGAPVLLTRAGWERRPSPTQPQPSTPQGHQPR